MGCRGRLDCHACLPLQAWQPLICHLALSFGPGFALGNPQVWAQCRPLHAAHGFFAADPIACERDGVGARQASEGGSERRCAQPFSSLPNLSHLRRRRRRWGQRPTRLGCAKAPWPRRFLFFYTPLALSTRHGPWESVGFNRRPTTKEGPLPTEQEAVWEVGANVRGQYARSKKTCQGDRWPCQEASCQTAT